MQWKMGCRASLILFVGAMQGCVARPDAQNFGVPYPPGWPSRDAAGQAPADTLQAPAIAGKDDTASAMTAFDAVQLGGWPAKSMTMADQAEPGIWLAHPSLPVPSYVEVTRLDNGRTVLARVAQRAAATKEGLVTLSDGLARQLALGVTGQAAFRIRRVNPPEAERTALRAGQKVADRLDTPEFLLAVLRKQAATLPDIHSRDVREAAAIMVRAPNLPAGNPQKSLATPLLPPSLAGSDLRARPTPPHPKAEAPPESGWFVQIAALSTATNAQALATQMRGRVAQRNGLYRVLIGPFSDEAAARAALGPLAAKGYPDARITR